MIGHLEAYLRGLQCGFALVAALFFVMYWRRSRDLLFAGFALSFLLEAIRTMLVLPLQAPNIGTWWSHGLRFLSALVLLAAIGAKNLESRPR